MAVVNNDPNPRMLVAIREINLADNTYIGWNGNTGSVLVYGSVSPGGLRSVPALGEQWLVQKYGGTWFLDDRTNWQDPKFELPASEGLTVVGGSGETHVIGERVDLPAETYIGGTRYAAGSTPAPTTPTTPVVQKVQKVHRYRIASGVGTRSVTPGQLTVIPVAARSEDDDAGVFALNQSGDATGTLTCLKAGRYRVSGKIAFLTTNTVANSRLDAAFMVNSSYAAYTTLYTSAPGIMQVEATEWITLAVNDKLTMRALYTPASGTAAITLNESQPYHNQFTIEYLG